MRGRSREGTGGKCAVGPLAGTVCILGQGWECERITQDRKMQREGRGMCGGSELYFEKKHNCTEICVQWIPSWNRPGS